MSMKHSPWRTGAAALLVGAVFCVVAAPAAHAADAVVFDSAADNSGYAYHLNPANEIDGGNYTVTWDPTSRTDDGTTSGSPAGRFGPVTVKISTGCPEGYRKSSRTFVVSSAGDATPAAVLRSQIVSSTGLTGQPITLTSVRASSWGTLTDTTNPTGVNAYVITCDAPLAAGGYPADNLGIGNSKYFVSFFKMDWATNHWEMTTDPRTVVPSKADTTTSASAAAVTSSSATLTATVTPADATGTVTFTSGAITQTATLASGTASVSVSGLSPATAYPFTVDYSGDATHKASTGTVNVTTQQATDSSSSTVGVTVPAIEQYPATGLKITVKPQAGITLTGPAKRMEGEAWTATGTTGDITVTDDRRQANAAWTLNGKVSALATTGGATIPASQLGWAPAKGSGAGAAGAAVAAGTGAGLSAESPLATGVGSTDRNIATTVNAALTLVVPATAAAGDYTGTLTLTLI